MSATMDHQAIRELLPAEAMELLSPAERAPLLAHLSTCGECTEELESLRATASNLALAAPERSFDARRCHSVRSRLLARTAADREARVRLAAGQLPEREPSILRLDTAVMRPVSAGWRVGSMVLAAAAAAIILIGGTLMWRSWGELSAARESVVERERRMADVMGAGVIVIEVSATPQRRGAARMFWNQRTDAWTFVAHELPPPPTGRTYQLWLITPGDRRISAGLFAPSRGGEAIARATYALAPDSLAAVAVTEEPAGGVAAPTGEIVLVGRTR